MVRCTKQSVVPFSEFYHQSKSKDTSMPFLELYILYDHRPTPAPADELTAKQDATTCTLHHLQKNWRRA